VGFFASARLTPLSYARVGKIVSGLLLHTYIYIYIYIKYIKYIMCVYICIYTYFFVLNTNESQRCDPLRLPVSPPTLHVHSCLSVIRVVPLSEPLMVALYLPCVHNGIYTLYICVSACVHYVVNSFVRSRRSTAARRRLHSRIAWTISIQLTHHPYGATDVQLRCYRKARAPTSFRLSITCFRLQLYGTVRWSVD
jgi:hypothetical protein